MKGFIKDQHIKNILGTPKVMGRLSDEQIREFYIMQKLDGYGEDAIVELMRTEKKTREEIETICGIRQEYNFSVGEWRESTKRVNAEEVDGYS